MGEVRDGVDASHAGTALEGVHISLQLACEGAVRRVLTPAVQGAAGGIDQVVGFFQEDRHQLLIQVGKVIGFAGFFRGDLFGCR